MHPSAMQAAKDFYAKFAGEFVEPTIVEIGSQNVNGSIREVAPPSKYVGLDFQEANGVDIVLQDAYSFPLPDNYADIVVTSSCFEHSEMFWLTFLEGVRILKPRGLFYINAPSTGPYHAYPLDCWRFYPDADKALQTWAKRNGYNVNVEYKTTMEGPWGDFVVVYRKIAN
jgi:ubiquinone/menaquinone biosynthesis C-methylase UbiE